MEDTFTAILCEEHYYCDLRRPGGVWNHATPEASGLSFVGTLKGHMKRMNPSRNVPTIVGLVQLPDGGVSGRPQGDLPVQDTA